MGSNKTSLTALVGRGVRKEKGLERIRGKLGFCRILYVNLFCCSGIFDSRIPLGVRYPWYPGFPFELRIHTHNSSEYSGVFISLPLPSATTQHWASFHLLWVPGSSTPVFRQGVARSPVPGATHTVLHFGFWFCPFFHPFPIWWRPE